VLLAALPTGRRVEIVSRDGLAAHAPRTVTSPEYLERDLAHVRRRGLAVEVGEFGERLACVAAPVHGPSGDVAGAVAVTVPVVPAGGRGALADRRAVLERVVGRAAERAGRALGGDGWAFDRPSAHRE